MAMVSCRRTPVTQLRSACIARVRVFVKEQVLRVARQIVSLYSTHDCASACSQYITDLQEFIFSQVVACDVQSVANEILHGVEDALAVKKREYVQTANINLVKFSNEVNIV